MRQPNSVLPRIDLTRVSPELKRYLRAKGVPWNFFGRTFRPDDLIAQFQYTQPNGKTKIVPRHQQIETLRKLFNQPLNDRPYLLVIGTNFEEINAGVVAAALFAKVCSLYLNGTVAHPPLWHPVYGGWEDKLRDEQTYRDMVKISMLVLSNSAANSMDEKVEKVRDLLHMYSDVPRIVTVAGIDPVTFCQQRLYVRPEHTIYLAERQIDVSV